MKRIKTDLDEPTNDQQVADILAQLGTLENEINGVETDFNKQILKLERRKNRLLRPHKKKLLILLNMTFNYLEMHRQRLLEKKGGKSVEFDTGAAWWKFKPPFLRKFRSEKAIINRLEKLGLYECVKVDKKVKKRELLSKLLADVSLTIRGVQVIKNEEELYIQPHQTAPDFSFKRSDVPQLEFDFVHPQMK